MEPAVQVSDIALMLQVREGSERAFETLHERYQHRVINFFYGMTADSHAANDLCQETFLRIWRVRKRYCATGAFPGYLFGIARMIWLERCRSQKKLWRLGMRQELNASWEIPANPAAGPDMCAVRSEVQEQILNALEELPEEQRMVFIMRNIHGLSIEDIAKALDCPVNTVRSRKILAVKKVRHVLSAVFTSKVDRTV